jgi:uncharacterized protein YcbK (DUF882 family)
MTEFPPQFRPDDVAMSGASLGAADGLEPHAPSPGRRGFLALAAGLCGLVAFGSGTAQAAARVSQAPRRLFIARPQAGESFKGVYFADGRYLPEAVVRIGRIMRDPYDDTTRIDPRLIDLMARMQRTLGTGEPLQIVSGYRSPRSNAQARSADSRVARNSFHTQGQAVDLRVDGYTIGQLRRAAIALQAGGVGTYPRRNFLHLDVGPVRRWG